MGYSRCQRHHDCPWKFHRSIREHDGVDIAELHWRVHRWLRLSSAVDNPDCRHLPRRTVFTGRRRRLYKLQRGAVRQQCWHDHGGLQRQLWRRSVFVSRQYDVFVAVGDGDGLRNVVRSSDGFANGEHISAIKHCVSCTTACSCRRHSDVNTITVAVDAAAACMGGWTLGALYCAVRRRRVDTIRQLRHSYRHPRAVPVLSRRDTAAVSASVQHTAVSDTDVGAVQQLERLLGTVRQSWRGQRHGNDRPAGTRTDNVDPAVVREDGRGHGCVGDGGVPAVCRRGLGSTTDVGSVQSVSLSGRGGGVACGRVGPLHAKYHVIDRAAVRQWRTDAECGVRVGERQWRRGSGRRVCDARVHDARADAGLQRRSMCLQEWG